MNFYPKRRLSGRSTYSLHKEGARSVADVNGFAVRISNPPAGRDPLSTKRPTRPPSSRCLLVRMRGVFARTIRLKRTIQIENLEQTLRASRYSFPDASCGPGLSLIWKPDTRLAQMEFVFGGPPPPHSMHRNPRANGAELNKFHVSQRKPLQDNAIQIRSRTRTNAYPDDPGCSTVKSVYNENEMRRRFDAGIGVAAVKKVNT